MKFFVIRHSGNKKIIGHYPQTKSIKQNCHVWDEPRFIEHAQFKKIDFEPITANAILFDSSKVTDLVNVVGMGFTKKLLASGKLKRLLENHRKSGLQFFNSQIIHKGNYLKDYWILSAYEINMELIDFPNSTVVETINVFNKSIQLDVKSFDEFEKTKKSISLKGNQYGILIEKIKILDEVHVDFFVLLNVEGGVKYVVSENLKKKIEDSECTGVEFQPIELSLAEWLQGGEREKVYGKA
jgi:hypothetical protein